MPRPAGPRAAYPSDLTDPQWALIEPFMPPKTGAGRPRTTDLREVVNAILYLLHEGCHWLALPHDFPPPARSAITSINGRATAPCGGFTMPCGTGRGSLEATSRSAKGSPLETKGSRAVVRSEPRATARGGS